MSSTLNASIDELREQAQNIAEAMMQDPRIEEIREILKVLNPLEGFCKQKKTTISSLMRFDGDASSETGPKIQPDEFVGLEALDAAKRYLKRVGRAALFADIVAGIKAGGGDVRDKDRLKVSLARSAWDVIKIGDDRFGLLEFYPHIKRGKKAVRVGKGASGENEEVIEEADVAPSAEDTEGDSEISSSVP